MSLPLAALLPTPELFWDVGVPCAPHPSSLWPLLPTLHRAECAQGGHCPCWAPGPSDMTCAVSTGPQRPAAHLRGEAPGLRDPSGQRGLQAPGDGRDWADPGPGPCGTCEHPNIAPTQDCSLPDTPFYIHGQQVCFFDLLGQQMKAFMFAACPGARLGQKQRQGRGSLFPSQLPPPPPYTHLMPGSTSTALPVTAAACRCHTTLLMPKSQCH